MLTYRGATIEDEELVLSLMQGLYDHEKIPLDDNVKRAVKILLKNPVAGRVFLIQNDFDLVGYAVLTVLFSLEYGGPCGFLDEFLILPEFRGKGFGREALNYFIESAKQEGLVAIQLEVDRENAKAKKLYESAGFFSQNRDLLKLRLTAE